MQLPLGLKLRKLLTAREHTVGISFTDTAIFASLPKQLSSRTIPDGIIKKGIVIDRPELSRHIKELLKEFNVPITFGVLSLPSALVFSSIIHLPLGAEDEVTFAKALSLRLDVELPWKKESAYTDYVRHNNSQNISVSIFSAPRAVVDPYILAIEDTGLSTLALEFDAMSVQRLMIPHEDNRLFVAATDTHANITIVNNNIVQYIFSMPILRIADKSAITNELSRIANYYTTETNELINTTDSIPELRQDSMDMLGQEINNLNYFSSLGAALRGVSRVQVDNEISLLPLRPTKLYRLQRLYSTTRLIRRTTIVAIILLICAHVLTYSVLASIAENISSRATQSPKLYSNIATIESQTKDLNTIISMGGAIAAQTKRFLPTLTTIDNIFTDGIYPTAVSVPDVSGTISIQGVAATRTQYNQFRTSLTSSKNIMVEDFPLGNLNLQTNIPFSAKIKLSNIRTSP